MSDQREPTRPLVRHDADEPARKGTVAGLVASARMWAREQGLPVSSSGPLPPGIVDRYRRRQQLRE